ncbi:MAG: hypothetical protein O3B13_06710 [Planctomycetota bacterium]|nr:hypothetical protein [Planctomycetota bacterium]MDA1162774.1 hypothetical protein [Planctomycetota bacterium]
MIICTYAIYLAASVLITVYVGHTLYRNGRCFLIDCLHGNERVADAVNHLLLAGYYLVNIAFVVLMLKTHTPVPTVLDAVDVLSTKIGIVCVTLGVMHFFNLFVLTSVKELRGRVDNIV